MVSCQHTISPGIWSPAEGESDTADGTFMFIQGRERSPDDVNVGAIFDTDTLTWRPVSKGPPRLSSAGWDGQNLYGMTRISDTKLWIWNLASGEWREITTTPSNLFPSRYVLDDNRWLFKTRDDNVAIFNLENDSWTLLPAAPVEGVAPEGYSAELVTDRGLIRYKRRETQMSAVPEPCQPPPNDPTVSCELPGPGPFERRVYLNEGELFGY